MFRNLWEHVGKQLPKKGRASAKGMDPQKLPNELLTAIDALYGHYEKTFEAWIEAKIGVDPVFIVVCNNTATSKLVHDYISGYEIADEHEDRFRGHRVAPGAAKRLDRITGFAGLLKSGPSCAPSHAFTLSYTHSHARSRAT